METNSFHLWEFIFKEQANMKCILIFDVKLPAMWYVHVVQAPQKLLFYKISILRQFFWNCATLFADTAFKVVRMNRMSIFPLKSHHKKIHWTDQDRQTWRQQYCMAQTTWHMFLNHVTKSDKLKWGINFTQLPLGPRHKRVTLIYANVFIITFSMEISTTFLKQRTRRY